MNVGDGRDAVIGGYGEDVFGSYLSDEYKSLLEKTKKGQYPLHPQPTELAEGSKLFAGGSFDDVLVSGLEGDYIIGDRINGREMYYRKGNRGRSFVPIDPRTKEPITGFEAQTKNILGFQPSYFKGLYDTWTTTGNEKAGASRRPAWIPGNDKIFSFSGDDFIFGDDNVTTGVNDGLLSLIKLRESVANVSTGAAAEGYFSSSQYQTEKLGADFIDAGDGADVVFGGIGGDAIIGGLGSDYIDAGPQIIAENYAPFFGTKIIYGDAVGSTDKSPDMFVVGDLLATEEDISNTGSAGVYTTEIGATKSAWEKFNDAFTAAGNIIGMIPYLPLQELLAGANGIVTIMDLIFDSANPDPPQPPVTVPGAPADALLVIKDFDAFDQLAIRIPDKASIEASFTTKSWVGIDNPLTGNLYKRGLYLNVSGNAAGAHYDRVFLQGYRQGLVRLNPEDDNGTILYGGADYLYRDTETNGLTFSQILEGRDSTLPPLDI